MHKESVDASQGEAARAEMRMARSIRLGDPEPERIEAFAEKHGVAAAEFVRFPPSRRSRTRTLVHLRRRCGYVCGAAT